MKIIREGSRLGATLLCVGALLGQAGVASARGGHGEGGGFAPEHGGGHGRMGGHGFPILRALRQLDLGEEQQQKVREAVKSHRDEMRSARSAAFEAREGLRTAAEAVTPDESAIRSAAARVGEAEGALAVLHARMYGEVRALLTETQRAQLDRTLDEMRDRMRERMQERRQGRGERGGYGSEPSPDSSEF